MHVVATAGHVDHGKSTLVRALTGTDPDRLAEEHRRGLSIELGFCWTELPGAGQVAFVDVPGHERFVSTMLAGVGPVTTVLFVVAADDPWMPQAAEHLAVLDALQVRSGLLVVTRADLADPEPARATALSQLRVTTLGEVSSVAVSAPLGTGLDELRAALGGVVTGVPAPDPAADVRLWLDRSFTLPGVGGVVTGTLPAGRLRVGDSLDNGTDVVRVRGMQVMGRDVGETVGTSRVALHLGRGSRAGRGTALTTPDAWPWTDTVDVRLSGAERVRGQPVLHLGAAAVTCRVQRLGADHARLALGERLPVRPGDRAVLRDPGSRVVWGVTILDPAPPPLLRRGEARRRAESLRPTPDRLDLADELRRRRIVSTDLAARLGVRTEQPGADVVRAGDWLLARSALPGLRTLLAAQVEVYAAENPLQPGLPVATALRVLDLPDPAVLSQLLSPPLRLERDRVVGAAELPQQLLTALDRLAAELTARPFTAPGADRLAALGLDARALAAAERAGRLLRLAPGVVVLPGIEAKAIRLLAALPQPFTASQARTALGTTRRVVVPLLARLDSQRRTIRLPDDTRRVTATLEVADGRAETLGSSGRNSRIVG